MHHSSHSQSQSQYSCTTKYNCQQAPNAKQNQNETGKQTVHKKFRVANGQVFSTLGQKSKPGYPFYRFYRSFEQEHFVAEKHSQYYSIWLDNHMTDCRL